MTKTTTKKENRKDARTPALLSKAAVLVHRTETDDEILTQKNTIIIKDISLHGIGFIQNLKETPFEYDKIYELKIKTDIPWCSPDFIVNISISRQAKEKGIRRYGAVYRNLTDDQITNLRKIIAYQKSANDAVQLAENGEVHGRWSELKYWT